MALRDTIQADGPLYYWPLDEANGDHSHDALAGGIGITSNATVTGGNAGQADGTSLGFNGTNAYGYTDSALSLSAKRKLLIEFLAYFDGLDNVRIICQLGTGSSGGFALHACTIVGGLDGKAWLVFNAANSASYGPFSTGAWHHFVAVIDIDAVSAGETTLYMDGVLQTPVSRPNTTNHGVGTSFADAVLYVGASNTPGLYYKGKLQHLAIYDALSDARIQAHYDEAFPTPATGYTLTGPAGGLTDAASTNFTVTPDGVYTGTITPSDGAGGGTFTPASLSYSAEGGAKTFTYTPAADGAHTIACTSSPALTDPASVPYLASESSGVVTVLDADLWGNGRDGTGAPKWDEYSFLRLVTDAATVKITGTTTAYAHYPTICKLGLKVDGEYQDSLVFEANETRTFTVQLPTGTKTIDIINGYAEESDGNNVLGTFLDSYELEGYSTATVTTPNEPGLVVILTDSIGSGSSATIPEQQGWPMLLRNTYGRNVAVRGWSYAGIYNAGGLNATTRTALAAALAGYGASTIWIALGTNDFGGQWWSSTDFGAAYADMLDKIHAAAPTVRIVCQTPTVRTDTAEKHAGYGDFAAYVSQIATAAASREWVDVVDGSEFLETTDLADNVHPNTAGHALYAAAVDAELGPDAPTDFAASSPAGTSGTIQLTWTIAADVTYQLSTDGGAYAAVEYSEAGGTATATITGLTNGQEYSFSLKAIDAEDNESTPATATGTPVDTRPDTGWTPATGAFVGSSIGIYD